MQGGEDQVVINEKELLTAHGDTVSSYTVSNDGITGKYSELKVALNVHYSKKSRSTFATQLENLKPDIVHVHNFFPLLTPSIYDACQDAGIPVVQTLHNYRTICPGALLLRDGKICEKCVAGSPYNAVVYKCYRDSAVGSLFVARMVAYHRRHKTWQTKVSRFIALTEFSKSKFIEAGFPENKIQVKPNFIYSPDRNKGKLQEKVHKALFVGRFSQEKGISVLLKGWDSIEYPLQLAGDGPLFEYYKENNQNELIQFLGIQTNQQISSLLSNSQFLIIPSICYESFGLVVVEAFSHGVPVICSNIGGLSEIVKDGVTGLHFKAGNSLDMANKVAWLVKYPNKCREMGSSARQVYEEKYTSSDNYKSIMNIYTQAIDDFRLERI